MLYSIDQLSRHVWRVRDAQTDPATKWFFDTRKEAEDFVRCQTEALIGRGKKTHPKHTPLPWEQGQDGNMNHTIEGHNEVLFISRPKFSESKGFKDAAFIIRACNNHYELLDALKTARKVLSVACGEEAPYIKYAFSIIDPAIAKAEGGAA